MTKPGKTTTTTTTQACTDLPGWADAWEDTCQNYTSDSQWCGRDYLSVRGISSDKACCACGGGSHQVSTLGYDNVDEGKFLMLAMDIATLFKAFTRGEGRRHAVCLREHR